ncbi:hypothetical protein E7T06_06955 [Deinococcus sp. Arct2-2]|uniref:hypothetical protein n=1 Tax=Deinococcus sp. Arct2-2 TaxID=2568653 RepID=UPI0010A3BE6C|nr:hypothetical protein [Deinococcus sp. Arct2-2]THF70438.1 hypothetical protein E7T06_06955 [Deinococcus sp. Arct2-2]
MKRALLAGLMLTQGWAEACDPAPSLADYLLSVADVSPTPCPYKQALSPEDVRECFTSPFKPNAIVSKIQLEGYYLDPKKLFVYNASSVIKTNGLGGWVDVSARILNYSSGSLILLEDSYSFQEYLTDLLAPIYYDANSNLRLSTTCLSLGLNVKDIFKSCSSDDKIDATGEYIPLKFELAFSPDTSLKTNKPYTFYITSGTCSVAVIEEVSK